MAERWLLTGGTGQVGGALAAILARAGAQAWVPNRAELDLAALPGDAALDAELAARGIKAIVNCAAYTAVDKAESEPGLAQRINAEAPGQLARAAARCGIPFIQVSTDYVFAGDLVGRGYREDDPVDPQSTYGRTKLAGEQAVAASGARHAIVRASWVVSPTGTNFIKTMLRLAAEREEVRVVADQHGCPSDAGELAARLHHIAARFLADPDQQSGVWHSSDAGRTTWHGMAERVFAAAAARGRKVPRLVAIATSEYPTAARRPANSLLDCTRLHRDFGLASGPWEANVDAIVHALIAAEEEQAA